MPNKISEDPRVDPRIKATFGHVVLPPSPSVPNREILVAAMRGRTADPNTPTFGSILAQGNYEPIAPSAGLTIRTETIASQPDGNRINLQIITPDGPGPWPCVYYIHGGGMAVMSCYDANYAAWGRMIAHQGVVVVMVDFRNALTASSVPEVAPFPAGLDDCVSGLRWTRANAAALNVDPGRIVMAGESGGGNLSVATALKLKQDGDLGDLKGLYVMCPSLAGEWPATEGSSALENAGILIDISSNISAMVYGIEAFERRDRLAWPGFATEADLAGFPPTVINVNECDPLRDDGVGLYRKLIRAGVSARCRYLVGTIHGTEVFLCCPDISGDVARDMAALARG